jgi:hypothetical protein
MKMMDIKMVKIDDIVPYGNNAKKHPDDQVEHIANSIKEFGFRQPLVIDENNVVVIGHGRLLAAKRLGMEEVPVLYADGLTDAQVNALRIVDNKTNESDWDEDALADEFELLKNDFDLSEFGFDIELEKEDIDENPYTEETKIPQYEPSDESVEIKNLYDISKTEELITEIEAADIPQDIKDFLKLGTYRHIVFNYGKIADFYAKSDKSVQELMEHSALVIIDYDNAIANGYTTLKNEMGDMWNGS